MVYTSIGISEELKLKLNILKFASGEKNMDDLINKMYDVYEQHRLQIDKKIL